MGQKERRSVREKTPSIHSISSSEVSEASDVSSDDGSSVHERSTPKIAAIIIVALLVIAILVGVTVYLTDTSRFAEEEIVEVVRHLGGAENQISNSNNNHSLKVHHDVPQKYESDFNDLNSLKETTINFDVITSVPSLEPQPAEEDYEEPFEDEEMVETILDEEGQEENHETLSDGSPTAKYPRQRSKTYLTSLDPIQNFKAYPGRPGYSGALSSVFEPQDLEGEGKLFFFQNSEKIPSQPPNLLQSGTGSIEINEHSGPKNGKEITITDDDKLELGGIGIFGGDVDSQNAEENLPIEVNDKEIDDYAEIAAEAAEQEFGIRSPGSRRQQPQPQPEEEPSSFTYRRGRLPPKSTTSKPTQPPNQPPTQQPTQPPTTTTTQILQDYSEEQEGEFLGEDENPFAQGKRLIPNSVFQSPSLPIRQQMGSFETHLRGGPFAARTTEAPSLSGKETKPPRTPRPMADSQPPPRPRPSGEPRPEGGRTPRPSAVPTLDRRPGRPPFHHLGPSPRVVVADRRGGPSQNQVFPQAEIPIGPLPRPGLSLTDFQDNISETPFSDLSHLVSLAKEEVAVLRDIARNITLSGKELNLWEVMNAVNITIRENPDSPVAGLMRRFYETYMENIDEQEPPQAPERGIYEKSISSLIFLSFGIFLLNSVNDIKAKQEGQGKTFGQNPAGRSLRALMSDRPEILSLFSNDGESRKLGEPAGQSSIVNNYLRLLMNLMRVYARSDSEEVDCVWTAYCHQLNLQAAPGGISSTVARINSVGLKLALRQLPGSSAFPSVIRSLLVWEDLPCDSMFPECQTNLETLQTEE